MNLRITRKQRHNIRELMLVVACLLLVTSGVLAQAVNPERLTRGKYWVKCLPNGALDRETTIGEHDWESLYPGNYNARSESAGGFGATLTYNGALVAGQPVAWYYRSVLYNSSEVYAVSQTAVTQNYNLINAGKAEEYLEGTIGSYQYDGTGNRHMKYELKGTVRVWSQPKYDDFIIMECTLTNTDDTTFNDFYYVRMVTPSGPYAPPSTSVGWDKEYEWDTQMGDTLGFIFYDDTSLPPTADPPDYSIPPGDSTGNAGDPGNIGIQGSTDFKLYAPYAYAYNFYMDELPPNKFGQKKIWRKIVSTNSKADVLERRPSVYDVLGQYDTLVNFMTSDEQPHYGWRAAAEAGVAGGGSKWERNPCYFYGIGPFDIKKGESIHWFEIFVAGQMDRNVSMLGGYEAARRFKLEGIENVKENFSAARTLIRNRWTFPIGTVPPPTPSDAPRVGNANELTAVASAITLNGERTPGVQLTWQAVHKGYVDPQTRQADFAAYRIYQSAYSIEGPWKLIDSVTATAADSLIVPGADGNPHVSYFVRATPNVPYRYCVTSIDTRGNESGMTGYTFFSVSAEPKPSNNQSDVLVVPNPFRQVSGFAETMEYKRLAFVNIPALCTIRIYTIALDLVRTLEHTSGGGIETWGSQRGKDYMLTDFAQNVQPGIYIYYIESHVPGHEAETSIGKFAIIK
ncbi:MAG: hypothetical protein WBD36_03340 [Bacteroidota bacterium]